MRSSPRAPLASLILSLCGPRYHAWVQSSGTRLVASLTGLPARGYFRLDTVVLPIAGRGGFCLEPAQDLENRLAPQLWGGAAAGRPVKATVTALPPAAVIRAVAETLNLVAWISSGFESAPSPKILMPSKL